MRSVNHGKRVAVGIGLLLILVVSVGLFFRMQGDVNLAFADSVEDKITEGRNYLAAHDLVNANNSFEQALTLDSAHPVANFFYSVTRLLATVYGPEFNDLLDRLGVSAAGRDIYGWTAYFQRDAQDNIILPSDSPTSGEMVAFLTTVLMPEIDGAIGNLPYVNQTFNLLLSPAETPCGETLEVDYGDVAFYQSLLYALKSLILGIDSYDLDVDIDDILDKSQNDTFSIRSS
ncbi:hypothetical protein KA005_18935, partial [bacterium]|nr:hypothetical protein [bacterium]